MLYIQIISHTSIEYINALYMIPTSESDITDIQTQVTWITGNMYIHKMYTCMYMYIYIHIHTYMYIYISQYTIPFNPYVAGQEGVRSQLNRIKMEVSMGDPQKRLVGLWENPLTMDGGTPILGNLHVYPLVN